MCAQIGSNHAHNICLFSFFFPCDLSLSALCTRHIYIYIYMYRIRRMLYDAWFDISLILAFMYAMIHIRRLSSGFLVLVAFGFVTIAKKRCLAAK